ncbi:MAG TPA: hypothetical protein EYN06_04790 [Myxococcales bacterium]|nr:hypothetical protein [Myxococcales bacterium]HIN85779.1 hypothetical protein [Myxococcales bacterium]
MKIFGIIIVVLATACASQVGDPCENSTQCGPSLDCDLTQPDGYCTQKPCVVNGCPDEAACIKFEDESTFCMARCDSSSDCRDDYVCVDNFGDIAFCNSVPFLGQ